MKFFYGLFFSLITVSVTLSQSPTASLKATFQVTTISNITVPYQNGMPVPSFEKQQRTTISLAGQWKKLRFAANHDLSLLKRDSAGYAQLLTEAADRQSPYYDDASWQTKNIPGVENTLNANEKVPEYYENGLWYRTKFSLPDSLKQKFVKLNFYAVNYVADVWLNGNYLGWHEGGYTPFSFDVSSALRFDSANVLVVRVDNIPWGSRNDIVPFYTCDWFNYAGIIHDVYLEFSDKISVTRADVITKDITGLVQATVVVNNRMPSNENVDVTLQVYKAKNDSVSLTKEVTGELAGSEVALQGGSQQTISVPADSIAAWQTNVTIQNPDLWSPLKPNLYILKVTLSQGGVTKDQFFTQFGVRTIQTIDDKILLNGKTVFLHGVARHEDHPLYGRNIPLSVIFSDLKMIKGVNANFFRSAHYPNHPFTYLAADRIGLLVWEEIPVFWFDDVKPWSIQNVVRKIHLQMFREMAFRDRNRPSIALWSTSNECKDVQGRITFLQLVKNDASAQYPDGRLITQSAAADRPGPFDESQGYSDVAAWTMYFGIFYDPYGFGIYRGTRNFVLDANDYYPKKPIIDCEFGYWSGESMSLFARQTQVFDSTFHAFAPRLPVLANGAPNPFGFVAGITWWCIFDWYSHQHAGGFQSMGLYRMDRSEIKPVGTDLMNTYQQYVSHSEYITEVHQVKSESLPKEFLLNQNYPNPFNPSTSIKFSVAAASNVEIKIYNLLGEEVETIVREKLEPGNYVREWNAKNLSSGMYLYRMHAGNYTETRKMLLLK
ncbi:MAG: glycoside hydrolase family 2 TIM barrel-domain containing protein [Bacteroidota bacterium]|nr:glycoside hydrolase family 2 TIM barrel-domain containing protein [Bacteroidota bacterium]